MFNSKPRSIGRLATELAIVVGGILIAFALDAWWNGRLAARWERQQLTALRDEFARNLDHLETVVQDHDAAAEDVGRLLSFLDSASPGQEREFPDSVLASLVAWRTSDISTGTLRALLASGELGAISNPELRRLLAEWPTRVADAQEDETLARDFVETVMTPALLGRGVLSAAYSARPGPGDVVGTSDPGARTLVEFDPILRDAAAARLTHLRLARASIRRLQAQADEITALLDDALRDR